MLIHKFLNSVGKTSLLNQYIQKKFSTNYKATIGTDFFQKEINVKGDTIQLQIWDTAGQERYQSLSYSFYRKSNCCFLVFDLTDDYSFLSIEDWRNVFLEQLAEGERRDFPFILLGNKSDLLDRKVKEEDINNLCEKYKMPYFETSAKNNINIEEAFAKAGELMHEKLEEEEKEVPKDPEFVKISHRVKKKLCCL